MTIVKMLTCFVIRHYCSSVDYTHQSGMQYFSSIDHFALSEQLYRTSFNSQRVVRDIDNTSDHDPVWLHLDLSISHFSYYHFNTPPKVVAWFKANTDHITAYENMLCCELRGIDILHEVLSCHDYSCKNAAHMHELDQFARKLTDTCLLSAKATIPFTKQCGSSGRIPGWNEYIALFRRESFFWHNLWKDCNRPSQGIVDNLMRKTRARYHAAIRQVRKSQADIVNALLMHLPLTIADIFGTRSN